MPTMGPNTRNNNLSQRNTTSTSSSSKSKTTPELHEQEEEEEEEEEVREFNTSCCFFCAIKEPDPQLRRPAVAKLFAEMPHRDEESDVLILSALWNIAMTRPDDSELPNLGALRCMSLLLSKSLADPAWLLRHQNIYIPYYAAHVLGSYTIRLPSLAALAVSSGALPPLLALLRGRLTWVEQRVAVRALGHLASYDSTFPAVAEHGAELVPLAMRAAATCLATVHAEFVAATPAKREGYHRDLLTRGLGCAEAEERRAEEWAGQLQCWSLYLLCCFANRDRSWHRVICRNTAFLRELGRMWGGLVNGDSPAGVGLMRILCRSAVGREATAQCLEVMESLCGLARSSDDWQYMSVDCLLLLINDRQTRRAAMEIAAPFLVDLAELRSLGARKGIGDAITEALLLDFGDESCKLGGKAERAIKLLWELKVERKHREELMTKDEETERTKLVALKKKEGNRKFWAGNVEEAIIRYGEALEICPLRKRKQRLVLYSNRAQCHLLMGDADAAASDATRALALAQPANWHAKSLWRRAQAYDMKGMAKESLMDTIVFVNVMMEGKQAKVPYFATRMINKQMSTAGLFAGMALGKMTMKKKKEGRTSDAKNSMAIASPSGCSTLPTIEEEPWRISGRRREIKDKGECSQARSREEVIV